MIASLFSLLLVQTGAVEVRLVENVGVVVTSGEHRIAFDAIADPNAPGDYTRADTQMRADVINGEGDFAEIGRYFVSGFTPSLLDSAGLRSFLEANPDARLSAYEYLSSILYQDGTWPSPVVYQGDQPAGYHPLWRRWDPITPGAHANIDCDTVGMGLDTFMLFGAFPCEVEIIWTRDTHQAFRFGWNGTTIVYFGEVMPEHYWRLWEYGTDLEEVDFALIPYSGLTPENEAQLRSRFPNARLVVTGIPAYMHPSDLEARFGPDGFLQQPGDTIVLEGGE